MKTSLRQIISPGPGWPSGLGSSTCTDHCNLSPLQTEFAPRFVRLQKRVCSTCMW